MARHNLDTVVGFEVTRALTKGRFWVGTLFVPIAMGLVIALIVMSSTTTAVRVDSQERAEFTFTYSDESGYVDPAVVSSLGGTLATDQTRAIEDVKSGKVDAYISYPSNPATRRTRVHARDASIFENGKYSAVATHILVTSARGRLKDATLASLVQGGFQVETTTYKEGRKSGGIGEIIPPLMFLAAFYVVMMLLGNQMVTSLLEEKESRVAEMIQTTVDPTTMVLGKVISLFVIGLVQVVAFVLPVLIGYVFFHNELNLPHLDLSRLVLEPGPMIVGALLLMGGFSLFTTTMVATGAVMPTAREAAQVSGPLMTVIFVPAWAGSLLVTDPHSPIAQVLTYFPYTAPVTAMLRNGLGTLNTLEAAIVILELFGLSIFVLRVAVRLFRYGSIEYSNRVALRAVFSKRS